MNRTDDANPLAPKQTAAEEALERRLFFVLAFAGLLVAILAITNAAF